jgi:hypothetical protein
MGARLGRLDGEESQNVIMILDLSKRSRCWRVSFHSCATLALLLMSCSNLLHWLATSDPSLS